MHRCTIVGSEDDFDESEARTKHKKSRDYGPMLIIVRPRKTCSCAVVYRDPANGGKILFAQFSDRGRLSFRNPYKRPPDQAKFILDVCNYCKERGKSLSVTKLRQLRSLAFVGVRKAFPLKKETPKRRRSGLDRRYKSHITLAAIDYVRRDSRIPLRQFCEDLCQRRLPGYRELQDEKERGPKRRSFMKSVRKNIESASNQAGTNEQGKKKRIVAILQRNLKKALDNMS